MITSLSKLIQKAHYFHQWETIYHKDLPGKGWFRHRQCKTCHKHEVVDHINFFASLSDAIELGIEEGFYKGFWNVAHPKEQL